MSTRLDRRYSLLTVAYLLAIYWLSSLPDLSAHESPPLVRLLMNLGHVPLYAGLAFCVLKSLSPAPMAARARYGLVFVACGACGGLDEWHQSFVPGRDCSLGDFLLDLAGIAVMLVLLRLHELRSEVRHETVPGGWFPIGWPSRIAPTARKK
jgi:VanZ family protein